MEFECPVCLEKFPYSEGMTYSCLCNICKTCFEDAKSSQQELCVQCKKEYKSNAISLPIFPFSDQEKSIFINWMKTYSKWKNMLDDRNYIFRKIKKNFFPKSDNPVPLPIKKLQELYYEEETLINEYNQLPDKFMHTTMTLLSLNRLMDLSELNKIIDNLLIRKTLYPSVKVLATKYGYIIKSTNELRMKVTTDSILLINEKINEEIEITSEEIEYCNGSLYDESDYYLSSYGESNYYISPNEKICFYYKKNNSIPIHTLTNIEKIYSVPSYDYEDEAHLIYKGEDKLYLAIFTPEKLERLDISFIKFDCYKKIRFFNDKFYVYDDDCSVVYIYSKTEWIKQKKCHDTIDYSDDSEEQTRVLFDSFYVIDWEIWKSSEDDEVGDHAIEFICYKDQ